MTKRTGATAGDDGSVRVLIADDDARVRHALRTLIESEPGITVVGEAASTTEVLENDRLLQPAVILLDLVLSWGEDSLGLLHLLAQERGRRVVAISMRGGLRRAALEAGACAFVEKGAAPDAVLGALRAAGTRTGAQA